MLRYPALIADLIASTSSGYSSTLNTPKPNQGISTPLLNTVLLCKFFILFSLLLFYLISFSNVMLHAVKITAPTTIMPPTQAV